MPEQDTRRAFRGPTQVSTADTWPARLSGFGPLGIVSMLGIPFAGTAFISAILVLVWTYYTRTPWRAIGYVRPKNWIRSITIAIIFGVAFKLVMKAIVMPLLGADPVNAAYHYVTGNRMAFVQMAVFVTLSGGFGEETVYRGFLFERFRELLATGSLQPLLPC